MGRVGVCLLAAVLLVVVGVGHAAESAEQAVINAVESNGGEVIATRSTAGSLVQAVLCAIAWSPGCSQHRLGKPTPTL